MSVERIDIVITENGSRTVSRNIEQIGVSARSAGTAVQQLTGILASLGLSLGVSQLVKYADTYQTIQNRLALVTTGTANLNRVTQELFDISQRTRVGFEATAQIYSRFAQNTQNLGLSQRELLDVVETVNKTVAISGATSIEARNALIQFSQGLASGTLRGDELRSVLEQLPGLAREIAKGMGIAYEDLRKVAKEGGLTPAKILEALKKQAPEVAEAFKRMTPTIAQSFTVLDNAMTRFIGQAGQTSGATAFISNAIIGLSNNLDTVAGVILTFGAVYTAVLGARLISTLRAAAIALNLFALSNPFTAILAALVALVAAVYMFGDAVTVNTKTGANLQDVLVGAFTVAGQYAMQAWEAIKSGATQAMAVIQGLWAQYGPAVMAAVEAVGAYYRSFINTVIGLGVGWYNSIVGLWAAYGPTIMSYVQPVLTMFQSLWTSIADLAVQAYTFVVNNWQSWASAMAGYASAVLEVMRSSANTIVGVYVGAFNAIVAAASGLPAAMGDIGIRAANALLIPIQQGVNKIIEGLNTLGVGLTPLSGQGLANPFAGAASSIGADVAKSFTDSLSRDYVGAVGTAVSDAVKGSEAGKVVAKSFTDSLSRDYVGEFGKGIKPALGGALDQVMKEADARAAARAKQQELGQLNPGTAGKQIAANDNKDGGSGKKAKEAKDEFLEAQKKQLKEIKGPLNEYTLNMRALDQLLKDGKISQEEYAKATDKIRLKFLETQTDAMAGFERALIKLNQEATNSAKQVETLLTNAFSKAEDAFVQFVKTGKFDFKSLANSIIEDLARIAFKQAVTAPLTSALGSLFGGTGGSGGDGGLLGSLTSGFKSLFGFATGGDFTVPGNGGGVDSTMVAFPATPGERVSVSRPGQSGGGSGGGSTVVNFNFPPGTDAKSFQASQSQIAAKMQRLAQRGARNM